MAVPDFQSIMLPLLGLMGDGAEHALAEAIESLGDRLGLSAEEKELLPSESDVKFDNRVRWAAFYLRKAGSSKEPVVEKSEFQNAATKS